MIKEMRLPILHKTKAITRNQQGFTAVEMLIAMAVFSSVLTLSVVGFVQINKMYQQGLAAKKTQGAARHVLEDIARSGRQSNYIRTASTNSVLCTREYRYFVSNRRMYKDPITEAETCSVGTANSANQLTAEDLRVLRFEVTPLNQLADGSGFESAQVLVRVATAGTDDLIQSEQCEPGRTGSQFCSVSELTTLFTTRGAAR